MKTSIHTKLFLSHFLAILLVSGSIGSYFYQSAIDNLNESLRSRLKYSAALLSESFESSDLEQIRSTADLELPVYQRTVKTIRRLAETNPDIAFIYIMRLVDGRAEFVLDSDTENTAMPGEIYQQDIPELMAGFNKLSVDSKINSDKWGDFMSGYAPISSPTEKYLIGLDMNASDVKQKLENLKTKGLMSLLMSIALAYVCSFFLAKNFVRRIGNIHSRCLDVASLKQGIDRSAGDELDQLSDAFGIMLDRQKRTQQELEAKVLERTNELQKANDNLLLEIDERERMTAKLRETARTDYLTGIINRREMTRLLQLEQQMFSSSLNMFSVVLLDLDGFKKLNDDHGHDAGDEVLKAVSKRLNCVTRDSDIIARWGGEEFLVLLPRTEQTEAVLLAEKMRKDLESSAFLVNSRALKVTSSFGVAEFDAKAGIPATLKQADLALYRAKQLGRNRVCIAEEFFAEAD